MGPTPKAAAVTFTSRWRFVRREQATSRWRFDEQCGEIDRPWIPLDWSGFIEQVGETGRETSPQAKYIKHLCRLHEGEVAFTNSRWEYSEEPLGRQRHSALWK